MEKVVQIRNVPEALLRRLKSRAALAGLSLSEYLLGELTRVAEQATVEELAARLENLPSITPSLSPSEALRTERDSR